MNHLVKKILIFLGIGCMMALGPLFSANSQNQGSEGGGDTQNVKELSNFEKILDSKIAAINKSLSQYSDLMKAEVHYTPVQSRFSQGDGYIQMEKYEFITESSTSTTVVGGKRKIVRLYYNGQTLSKVESTYVEENYILRTKKVIKVVDPSPGTEDNGDITIFRQINQQTPTEYKLADMQNTVSNPNRNYFKKEFYISFLSRLDEDLRYTEMYLSLYGTNAHIQTINELKKAIDF